MLIALDPSGEKGLILGTMTTYYVIPCGAEKQDKAAPARDLYTGSMFKHTLAAALAQGDRVLVMSAKHGAGRT